MKCNRCGFDNPDYLEYCQNCTAPLDNKKGDDSKEPAWGFVKAPKWAKPEFSADTVTDEDVPSDFVKEAGQAADTAAAVAAAAGKKAGREAKRAEHKLEETADELADEVYDELEDDFDDFEEEGYEKAKKASPFAFIGGLFRHKPAKAGRYEYDDDEGDFDESEDYPDEEYDDADELEDFDDAGPVGQKRAAGAKRSRDLGPIIKIVGVVAALAVLAAAVWLIARSAKGCSKPVEYDPPVVEQSADNPDIYFVTVHAAEGTNLIYETADGTRTAYTVPKSCQAIFKVPVSGLLPGEPVDGSVYYATPKVLISNEEGETAIPIDPIAIPVAPLEITFDNESTDIVTKDGTAVISGRIEYINAVLTIDGEQVEVAGDGTFKKTLSFEEAGTYSVPVEAKLPNYQIAKRTFTITVDTPVIGDPDAIIQMPWDYGDYTFSQRVVNSVESIDVRGKVPEGSTVTASSESTNATITTPTVDADGTFHFTITMAKAGDYTVRVTCKTPQGVDYEREIHLQRQPDYSSYIQNAWAMDFAAFSFGNSQQYKIEGKIKKILHDGDYYLAEFELTDGHTVVIEYHPHYGSAAAIEEGKSYSQVYGRSWGFGDDGNIRFYVWFING